MLNMLNMLNIMMQAFPSQSRTARNEPSNRP